MRWTITIETRRVAPPDEIPVVEVKTTSHREIPQEDDGRGRTIKSQLYDRVQTSNLTEVIETSLDRVVIHFREPGGRRAGTDHLIVTTSRQEAGIRTDFSGRVMNPRTISTTDHQAPLEIHMTVSVVSAIGRRAGQIQISTTIEPSTTSMTAIPKSVCLDVVALDFRELDRPPPDFAYGKCARLARGWPIPRPSFGLSFWALSLPSAVSYCSQSCC